MLLSLAPQKFTTFTTFAMFAIFAKFTKFANINSTLEHTTLIHRHAPRLRSISERRLLHIPPLPAPTGRVPA
jgi:hypothetical protein